MTGNFYVLIFDGFFLFQFYVWSIGCSRLTITLYKNLDALNRAKNIERRWKKVRVEVYPE